jgi:hypothetical protein
LDFSWHSLGDGFCITVNVPDSTNSAPGALHRSQKVPFETPLLGDQLLTDRRVPKSIAPSSARALETFRGQYC